MADYRYSKGRRTPCLVVLIAVTVVLCQGQNVTVVLDVYTPTSTLDNNTTLQLGTTCILLCRTGGLPHGTDYNYTWTCPNGPCTIGQGTNTNRDTYGDRLLLNILSYSDAGTYTCQVRLATTGQLLGMDQFSLRVQGGIVLHSGTNLIPNNDFITSLQDITSSTTITIQCTSHQQPHWRGPNGQTLSTIQNNTLHQVLNGNTSTLTIDTSNLNNFTNGRFSCHTTQHTANVNLYIGPGGSLPIPAVTSRSNTTHTLLSLKLQTLTQVSRFIVSYQRQDLNVPLDVEYQEVEVTGGNTEIAKEVSIPGVMYLVLMWSVNGSQYSPAPVSAINTAALQLAQAPSQPRLLTVTTTVTQGLELNWIPPKQPNGPILYQLNYGTNTTQFNTVDTTSDDTYYNLTGLQQNTTYYIRVVAVTNSMALNGVPRTEGEWITATTEKGGSNATFNMTTTTTPIVITSMPTPNGSKPTAPGTLVIGIAVGASAGLLLGIIVILIAVVGCLLCCKYKQTKKQPPPAYYSAVGPGDIQKSEERKQSQQAVVTVNTDSNTAYMYAEIQGAGEKYNTDPALEKDNIVIGNEQVLKTEKAPGSRKEHAVHRKEHEYADVGTKMEDEISTNQPAKSTAFAGLELEDGYTTIPDGVNDAEYSEVVTSLARNNSKQQDQPPDYHTQGVYTQPQKPPEAMEDNTRGDGYEKIPDTPPPSTGSIKTDSSPPPLSAGYELIDTDSPPLSATGDYEEIGYSTVKNEQQVYPPNYKEEELYTVPVTPEEANATPEGPTDTNTDIQTPNADTQTPNADTQTPNADTQTPNADTQTPNADTQTPNTDTQTPNMDDLYTQPDVSKKTRNKPKADRSSDYQPTIPSFDPELLYTVPDKKNTPN